MQLRTQIIHIDYGKHEPNYTADYALNPGLMTNKTLVNKSCFNLVAYTEQQQTIGRVDNGCH